MACGCDRGAAGLIPAVGYRRCSGREVGYTAVLVAVVAGVSFQPQWLQAKSSWGLGLVANSPQRGHFIVHMVDLPVMVR